MIYSTKGKVYQYIYQIPEILSGKASSLASKHSQAVFLTYKFGIPRQFTSITK